MQTDDQTVPPAARASAASGPVIDAGSFQAIAVDLDGVITRTAGLHAVAWRQLFDDFLRRHAASSGEPFRPFDAEADYLRYVDGRPREDGIRSFLASRGIALPDGGSKDPLDADTVHALGARKNKLFLESLARCGVEVFPRAIDFLKAARQAGLRTAVVSSSRNAEAILAAAGLTDLFEVRIDGLEAARLGLKGKPAPDTFIHAARRLGVTPARILGVEDALAGVEAIRAAGYGLVIGIDRSGQTAALRGRGADLVVSDLGFLHLGARRPAVADAAPKSLGQPSEDLEWLVLEEGFSLTREHEVESLFAIANGRLGARGSLAEGSPMSAPATFMAGLFEAVAGSTPALALLPDWAGLSIRIEGGPLRLDAGRILEHRRILDLRQGATWREWRQEDASGRITCFRELRFVSLADRRLLAQSIMITPENYSGLVTVETTLSELAVRRTSAGVIVAMAASGKLVLDSMGRSLPLESTTTFEAELGRSYRIDRIAAVCTSKEESRPEEAASAGARDGLRAGFGALFAAHRAEWAERWAASDVRVAGDPRAQRALRFAAYHLISAANPADGDVSIGARALSGGAYNGHVFWDADIYMLPFFALTWPEAARALLEYRFRTLPAARAKAARLGWRGAFYAWESADTGDDVTPAFVIGPDGLVVPLVLAEQEQHISADVAYATWNYWRLSGDDEFLLQAGAEILFETARFWASRAQPGDDGLRHIRNVVGPDEYHEAVDDDAYTNGMAQWNLETAANLAGRLAERWPERWRELSRTLGIGPNEPAEWGLVARELYTGLDPRTGLIEQFQGYFGLEDIDLSAFQPRNAPIEILLGRERIQRSKIIKQPDVIMLLFLLGDRFPQEVKLANFRFYEPRCAHGSSLSPAIHALMAAQLGDLPLADRYFRQASEIDLADNMGNAAAGVHAAALGGLWQAAVFGFAGLRFANGDPELAPRLPPAWRGLAFRIRWLGRDYDLAATPDQEARP